MHKVNQDTYARVFKELLDGPISAYDASDVSGIHVVTAQSLMRSLKKHKVVHVTAWEPDSRGRDATPVYQLGEGRDRKRRKMTGAERQAKSREKRKMIALVNLKGVG